MESKELTQRLEDMSLDSLSALEWRKILLEVIKTDDQASLISLLHQIPDAVKDTCLGPVNGSNLLEFAILDSSWKCADVIVQFECGVQLTTTGANKDYWANAISKILKRYRKSKEIRSLQNKQYQSILQERMKAYYRAYEEGRVDFASAVNYPSTFILLMQLTADLRETAYIIRNTKVTNELRRIMPALIESKILPANTKIQLIRYISEKARELLTDPSGPEGMPPMFYFYQGNCRRYIRAANIPFYAMKTKRSESGKTLADVISVHHLSFLIPKDEIVDYFLQDNNLSNLVQRAEKLRVSLQMPEIAQALEVMVKQHRPIDDILRQTSTPYVCAYLYELGLQDLDIGPLKKYCRMGHKVNAAKRRIENIMGRTAKNNNIGRFPLDQLPMDILAIFAAYLFVQEVMAMFSISKSMRGKYKSNLVPLLWKNVAKNTFNKVKFAMHEQNGTNEWKGLVHSEFNLTANWVNGKYKERDLVTDKIAWLPKLSEHWACWNENGDIKLWNCNTDAITSILCTNYLEACFIDSSPSRALIATTNNVAQDSVVNILSNEKVLSSFVLPQHLSSYCLSSLDKDHVIVGDYLGLVDINQQKVIKRLPQKTASILTVNKFTSSPTIASFNRETRSIKIHDRDLKLAQTVQLPWYNSYFSIRAIDEYQILLTSYDKFVALDSRYTKEGDIYSLSTVFPHRDFMAPWNTPVIQAVDASNNRMVMDAWKYGLTMIWDLKTLTWSAVRRNNTDRARANVIAMNSRYQLINDCDGHIRVHDYS